MAQLKDSLITGDLRVTGTIYGDANLSSLNASGTGLGTNGQILTSTGTGLAWSNNVTPSSHTHGQITNDGKIASNTTIATADSIVYSDASDSNKLKKDSAKNVANALINSLDTGSSVLTANDYVITQYVNGGTTTTTYHRRPASALRVGGLLTARNLGVNLASTTAVTFDGTANQTNIPVSGTLPIANGGTGQTTIEAVRKSWKVIAEKDYTGVIASANNDAGGIFHFLKIRPTTFNAQWTVKGKIWATTPAGTLYTHNTEFMITGDTNTYRTYSNFNTRNNSATLYYYIVPYCLKEAGYNAGYSHCLGINLRYATNNTNTNWTRNFHIEIWESDNCTIEFFDTMTAHGSVPGYGTTNYNNYWNLNAVDIGLQETSDANDVNYYNREQYDSKKAKNAIKRYMLLLSVDDEYVMGVTEVDNSTATTKAMSTERFDPFREIFFWQSTTTYAAGANIGDGMYRQYLCDIRYALNVGGYQSTSVLTARKPLYLVASPTDDGMATLHTTPFSQSLPTTNDGLLYIYLGMVYPDTNPYRLYLTLKHPVYKYTSSGVKEIIPAAEMDTAGNVISTTYAKKSDLTNLVAATDAMIFKGTLGTGGTITALPNSHTRGDTYRVITAGTYAGVVCEIGDLIMCINSGTAAANADWTVAQTNIDGAVIGPASVTSGHVVTFNGGTGKLIQDSGYTIASNVPANAKFTDTNYYHTTGSWNGLTYTATANGGAGALALTIPTGTTGTTVALGNHIHGKITNDGKIASTDNVIIANNDRLIISDASDNYILKNTSIVFDGSTTTKALTQKGTWETFNNYSHPTGDGNKHVPANGTSNNGKFLQATETAGTYQWASLPTASTGAAGIIQIGTGASNAAAGNHTHTTSIATSSGTNQITLALGTKYAITAGGTSYVFTMPSNPNTDTKVRQTLSTTNDNYPLLLAYSNKTTTTANIDNISYRNNSIYANPSLGQINATSYKIAEAGLILYNSTTGCIEITT